MATFSQSPGNNDPLNGTPNEIPQEQVEPSNGFIDVDDVFASPFRAAEGLLRGTISMIDMIPGVDSGIAEAPRFLGSPDTAFGGFLTGSMQFLMGFIPIFGSLGTAGNVARAARIAATQGRTLSRTGQAAAAVGRVFAGGPVQRAMAAGAFTDFVGYDGNEARLSDLIEGYPGLKNPISGFLASDENDPEALGRLKNSLEGLGLGVFTDMLVPALRGMHKQRKMSALGFPTKESADEAMSEASKTLQDAIEQAGREVSLENQITAGKRFIDLGDGDLVDIFTIDTLKPGRRKKLAEAIGLNADFADEVINDKLRSVEMIRDSELVANYPEHHPRNLTSDQRAMAMIERDPSWNGTTTVLDLGGAEVIRALELMQKGDRKQYKQTGKQLEALAGQYLTRFAHIAGEKPEIVMQAFSAQAQRLNIGVMGAIVHANAGRMLMRKISGELYDTSKKILNTPHGDPTLDAAFVSNLKALEMLRETTMGLTSTFGTALRSLGHKIGADAADNVTQLSDLILNGGTREQQTEYARAIALAYDQGSESDIAGLQRFMKLSPSQKGGRRLIHYFLNSILSGPKTIVINVASPLIYKGYSMGAESLGGAGQMLSSGGQNTRVLKGLWSEVTGMWQGLGDSVKAAQVSWRSQNSQFARDVDTAFGDSAARKQFGISPFNPESFGAQEGTISHRLLSFVDSGINLPLRAARSGDELTKQIVGRGHARKQLTMEALSEGYDSDEAENFVRNGMDKLFFEGELFNEDQIKRRGMKDASEAGVTHRGALLDAGNAALARESSAPDFDVFSKISERVRDHTTRSTFTGELPDGSLTRKLQGVITAHPMMKIFLPFVQTPTNLLKEGLDNFAPLTVANLATNYLGANTMNFWRNNGMKHMADSSNVILKQIASENPDERWEAGGRLAASFGMTTWAVNLAMEGRITGSGPADPELRDQMTTLGWQPYSIRTNSDDGSEMFVQFGRLDPLAVTLGLIGDYAEVLKQSGAEEQEAIEGHMSALVASMANLLTQKSYFSGIKSFVETMSDGQRNTSKAIGQLFGSVVPNVFSQVGGSQDPLLRELEGAMDSLRYRLPTLQSVGVSGRKTLPPARNILGEQVHRAKSLGEDAVGSWANALMPVTYRTVKDGTVDTELVALQHGFTPPRQTVQGLDLRTFINPNGGQDSYDRWQQLSGTTKLSGRTLKQELKRLIKSPQYQRMDPVSNLEFTSPRVTAIQRVISKYRQRAFRTVRSEYPALTEQLKEVQRLSNEAKRSGGFEALTSLQSGLPTFTNPLEGL